MLQWLYTHVARVCSKCFVCFSDICCKCFIWMLHMFRTYVVSVLSRYCICLHRLSSVFRRYASASDICCKSFRQMLQVFRLFQTYVASVSSRCCKSRSGVAYIATGPTCHGRLLQLLGCRAYGFHVKRAWESASTGTSSPRMLDTEQGCRLSPCARGKQT
jgi:hypothetical protein